MGGVTRKTTHCSLAITFMPSSSTPVTLVLRYCRTGAPFGGASLGIVKLGSGCADAARDPEVDSALSPFTAAAATLAAAWRMGVLVRAGRGEGALSLAVCGWGVGDCFLEGRGREALWSALGLVVDGSYPRASSRVEEDRKEGERSSK